MKASYNFVAFSIVVILVLGAISCSIDFRTESFIGGNNQDEQISLLSTISYDPFEIASNADFVSQGWPGSGTKVDPFLIEDLEIYSSDTCITIRTTDAYFVVRGCVFTGPRDTQGRAISLEFISNGTVDNCSFESIQFGIRVEYSDNLTLTNNACNNIGYGISASYSDNLTIAENTITNAREQGIGTYICDNAIIHANSVNSAGEYGLWTYETRHSFLTNNTVTHSGYRAMEDDWYPNSYGMRIANCFNNSIIGNIISDSRDCGIELGGDNFTFIENQISASGSWGDILYYGDFGTFIDNILEDGFFMYSSTGHSMSGNTVNGKPLGYFYSLTSTSIDVSSYGQVILDNCNNVEVTKGDFSGVVVGIHLQGSPGCIVSDADILNAREGIRIRYSSDCMINMTNIDSSIKYGIYNENSDGTIVLDCNITNSGGAGVRLDTSDNCNLTSNLFSGNIEGGAYVYESQFSIVKGNSFYGDGLVVISQDTERYNQTVIDNYVNDKPLGYFYNQNGGTVSDAEFGQLFIAACDNFVIDNCNVSDASNGIIFGRSTDCIIQNSNLSNNVLRGIWDFFSTGSTIQNCIITNNGAQGIQVSETDYTTIDGNVISENNGDGLSIGGSDYTGIVDNQIIANEGYGILCDWPSGWMMYRNNISNNGDDGLFLWHGWNLDIQNNTVTHNSGNAFFLDETEYSTFRNNMILYNLDYGFYVNSQCGDNTFYNNTIGDLSRDDGTNNEWDNGVNLGNVWEDYNGEGVYEVPGSGGGIDHYPRVLDLYDPIISSPSDFTIEQATSGNFITWTISDKFPANYTVYRNSSIFISDDEVTQELRISIDEIEYGLHNFTIIVFDLAGHFATDTVFVTAVDTSGPIINSPNDIYYVVDETGNFVTWTAHEPNPSEYVVYRNGTLVSSGTWNSTDESISVDIDGLALGVYNYTVALSDIFGYHASDTVIVNVVTELPTTGNGTTTEGELTTFTIIVTIGSLGVILAVLVLIIRARSSSGGEYSYP